MVIHHDYWRYEIEDMYKLFSDFEILILEKDPSVPGVFLKARKPLNYEPTDLQGIALYSMILGKRTTSVPKIQDMPLSRRFKLLINEMIRTIKDKIWNIIKIY
jgi:hypothetical protein